MKIYAIFYILFDSEYAIFLGDPKSRNAKDKFTSANQKWKNLK